MGNPLNSTKGAELIETETGRRCTRQNLDKLCERGALRGSPCILQAKPLRVDADLLVSEYLAKVSPHQAEAQQPRAKREPAAPRPPQPKRPPAPAKDPEPADLPDYNVSRARSEYEKANLLELDRKTRRARVRTRPLGAHQCARFRWPVPSGERGWVAQEV